MGHSLAMWGQPGRLSGRAAAKAVPLAHFRPTI
jgi:hypothetical protein